MVGAQVLAGCDWPGDDTEAQPSSEQQTTSSGPTTYTSDVALLTAAVNDESSLLNACDETVKAFPEVGPLVEPIAHRQRAHVDGLRAAAEDPFASDDGVAASVPRRLPAARRALLQAVSQSAEARMADCIAADSGLLARLFASVAASHAQTVETLRRVR